MNTVGDALLSCGVPLPHNNRLADEIFGNEFAACMDKTMEELDADFKTFSELTRAAGQIRLTPGTKRNIKAFVQWTRDKIRLGVDPATVAFPVGNAADFIRRMKTHDKFVKDTAKVSDAAKPEKFTSDTKWEDWKPSFLNYLRCLNGRDGIPLKYICRDHDAPQAITHADFLDDYVSMAPLAGEAYSVDAATVHTLRVNFISGNTVAESKIQVHEDDRDGRLDFKALQEHYEGVGVLSLDITKAQSDLEELFYYGEKRPVMWWDEFERRLTKAFVTFDKKEKRMVHSQEMKLRTLIGKLKAGFLEQAKSTIQLKLLDVPLAFTYEQAIKLIRNTVNQRYPIKADGTQGTRRQMNELGSSHGRGRGRGHGRSWGRGRGRGRGRANRTRPDSTYVTLMNGRRVEFHPDISYTSEDFRLMKKNDKDRLSALRKEKKEKNQLKRNVAELQSQLSSVTDIMTRSQGSCQDSCSGSQGVPTHVSLSSASTQSSSSMFGGRNSQLKKPKK